MIISLHIIISIIILVYILISILHIINQKRNITLLFIIILSIYLICLIILTLCTASSLTSKGLSIKGVSGASWFGKDILLSFSGVTKSDAITNLIMLYPMGYLTALLCTGSLKRRFFKGVLAGVLTSFIIEFLQFALPILRAPSLSDLIFNSISALLGALMFLAINKLFHKTKIN